jgi:hypothetical protein
MGDGNRIAGRTTIPVKEMALNALDKILPHCTPEQITALKTGKPVPPSPDWIGTMPMSQAVIAVRDEADAQKIAELTDAVNEARTALREKVRREMVFDDIIANARRGGPSVTAVLVFSDPKRLRRARKAVNQFVAQSYPNKQIVIVNASTVQVTNVPHKAVLELDWPPDGVPNPSPAELRNHALDHATGDFVFPFWDDDDVYDADLLTYLVARCRTDQSVALTSQIRVDIVNSAAHHHVERDGIPNALLCPLTDARFDPTLTLGEDLAFWQRHWGTRTTAVDNSAWPLNSLLMRVHDGNNVVTREAFMGGPPADAHERRPLSPTEEAHMLAVLRTFGLKAEPRATPQPTPA